jgi:hypothetical protein
MPATKTRRKPAHKTAKKAIAKPAAKVTRKPKATEKKEIRKGPDTEITEDVLEFIRALDSYKREKNRPFPTWSEVLEVVKRLGYRR